MILKLPGQNATWYHFDYEKVFINKKENYCRVCKTHDCTHFDQQSKCVVTHQLAGALRQTLTDSNPQILT